MNYFVGIIKILFSLFCLLAGIGLVLVMMDALSFYYPGYAKYILLFTFIVIANDVVFMMIGGIQAMRKKYLTRNLYTLTSIGIIYLSFLLIVAFTVFLYSQDIRLQVPVMASLMGLEFIFLSIAIYDSFGLKKS